MSGKLQLNIKSKQIVKMVSTYNIKQSVKVTTEWYYQFKIKKTFRSYKANKKIYVKIIGLKKINLKVIKNKKGDLLKYLSIKKNFQKFVKFTFRN